MQPEFNQNRNNNFNQIPQANFEAGRGYEIPPNYSSPENLERNNNVERRPNSAEIMQNMPVQPMQVMPTVQMPPVYVAQPTPNAVNSGPQTASDGDVIEKEWVDKAKQILQKTRNDPRTRELAIGELQKDYLRKRYGKEIGTSNQV